MVVLLQDFTTTFHFDVDYSRNAAVTRRMTVPGSYFALASLESNIRKCVIQAIEINNVYEWTFNPFVW